MKRFATLLMLTMLAACFDDPQSPPAQTADDYTVEVMAEGLNRPWNIAWLPGGDMLVTERAGRLRIVRDGALLAEPVSGLPDIVVDDQGGLFEAVPHPDFANNAWVYLTYSSGELDASTLTLARARFTATETSARLEDLEVLFEADALRPTTNHYGGRMIWLPDGTLLLTSGDGYTHRLNAQNLSDHFGVVVRLTEDGAAPPNNPFVDEPDARPEIWSYGHRNPQGIALAPDGVVYTNEHGPLGGDEINRTAAGENYGWPIATYGRDYTGAPMSPFTSYEGMVDPLTFWTPSIAPSDLLFYTGEAFPDWNGKLLSTALAGQQVRMFDPDNPDAEQVALFTERNMRLRTIAQGPDGLIYIGAENGEDGGQIWRVTPQAGGD